ncbi:MAG TPA: DUF481 domain-containing protein [Agriterribacter sp.]|nr:DUF481 domain-containing protein [Agriterribacter sp.]
MNKVLKTTAALILPVFMCVAAVSQSKDTLFFNNGDVMVGELKNLTLGKFQFDSDNLNIITIKISKIKTIHAVAHIYRLVTIHRKIYYTTIEPAGKGDIIINVDGVKQTMLITEITSITPLNSKTGAFWEGNVSLGYSYTRSSKVGRINSGFTVGCYTRKLEYILQGSVILTQADSALEFDNGSSTLFTNYLLTPFWNASVFVTYQRNLAQGLARRFQEGIGGGINAISSSSIRTKLVTGLVFNQELSVENVKTPTQMELPLILLFSFFRFNNPDLSLNLQQSLYAGITQKGRFRQDAQINLTWKIISDLHLNLQLYDNFDNQPPGENAAKADYGVVFGVTYRFSQ